MTPEDAALKASFHLLALGIEEAIAEATARLEARVRELEQRELDDLLDDD